jgi:hypothetical protein
MISFGSFLRTFHYTAGDADGRCWRVDRRAATHTGDTNGSCTPAD